MGETKRGLSAACDVSVAILSWNGLAHLKTCLEAVAGQRAPGIRWEILVLDNGSNDGTAEWVRRHHPKVRLIASEVNLGFCGGNNRLVDEAQGASVAFLNNDARPREDWLAHLVRALAEAPTDVAAVSGAILDWEGKRLDFAEGVLTFDGHAFQEGYHRPLKEIELPPTGKELLFPCGGNMLVRKDSLRRLGGFDPSYFAYLEDVDLGWRLWSGGERVTFAAEAVVHHRSMATSDLLGLYNRGFLFERNAFLTAYKNYDQLHWSKMMPAVLLTFLSRAQTMLVENNPGGSLLGIDPYAGAIANTALGQQPALQAASDRGWLRRAVERLGWRLISGRWGGKLPVLSDERSMAQLRALHFLLKHLDSAARSRSAIQGRRRRPDREIFERFPLAVVPTYPGDEALFSGKGFEAWLPDDVPLIRRSLSDIMALE